MRQYFRYIRHVVMAAVVATVLVVFTTQTLHAEGFWNCITIWSWETCYWVEPEDQTGDGLFQAMYALCQFLGLCP